jgi:hypothetical protein
MTRTRVISPIMAQKTIRMARTAPKLKRAIPIFLSVSNNKPKCRASNKKLPKTRANIPAPTATQARPTPKQARRVARPAQATTVRAVSPARPQAINQALRVASPARHQATKVALRAVPLHVLLLHQTDQALPQVVHALRAVIVRQAVQVLRAVRALLLPLHREVRAVREAQVQAQEGDR